MVSGKCLGAVCKMFLVFRLGQHKFFRTPKLFYNRKFLKQSFFLTKTIFFYFKFLDPTFLFYLPIAQKIHGPKFLLGQKFSVPKFVLTEFFYVNFDPTFFLQLRKEFDSCVGQPIFIDINYIVFGITVPTDTLEYRTSEKTLRLHYVSVL